MAVESKKEKLIRHFAGRVTAQARLVLESWQHVRESHWEDQAWLEEMQEGVAKLGRYAARFDMTNHLGIAQALNQILKKHQIRGEPVSSALIEEIDQLLEQLAQITQRKSDKAEPPPRSQCFVRSPIYIAINDRAQANQLLQQMVAFGFRGEAHFTHDEILNACQRNAPETIIVDVDFEGRCGDGLALVTAIQSNRDTPIPILFISRERKDIRTRLSAVRNGGEEFFTGAIDISKLIERLEVFTQTSQHEPYRVMIMDDSKAQATYIKNVLEKAGMEPHVVNDPLQLLTEIEVFHPELIIMDMYMPHATGTELAKVVRQQNKYVSVPIIYLSAEDDINKQLHAMSLGGDDFLTKPIDPRHLIATINNRGRRARAVRAMIDRDSLTGLLNHTSTLSVLQLGARRAKGDMTPLCFAMLDIDYFKQVNDTYGHPVGDRVLRSFALFLKQRLRKTDFIGRYGGEEFAIIFPKTRIEEAEAILNDIRVSFAKIAHPAETTEFKVHFSAGVAQYDGQLTPQQLTNLADKALYMAKRGGRNQVVRATLPTTP